MPVSTAWGATYVPIWPAEPVERPRRHGRRRLHRERAITGWLESLAEHLAGEARDHGVTLLAELPARRPSRRPAAAPARVAWLAGPSIGLAADGSLAAAPAAVV